MVGIHEQPQENRYDREATTDRVEHKAEEPRWQHADAGRLVPSGKSAPAAAAGVGVDAAGHFILGLSQEAFGSTPVDQVRVAVGPRCGVWGFDVLYLFFCIYFSFRF